LTTPAYGSAQRSAAHGFPALDGAGCGVSHTHTPSNGGVLERAGNDEVDEGGGAGVGEGPEFDGELEDGGGAGGKAGDTVAVAVGFEGGGGEQFETGIVADEDRVPGGLGDLGLDDIEEPILGGEVDILTGFDGGGIEIETFGDDPCGGAGADGGGSEDVIGGGNAVSDDLLREIGADFWGGFLAALVERTFVVAEGEVGPGRLGVADEGESFHNRRFTLMGPDRTMRSAIRIEYCGGDGESMKRLASVRESIALWMRKAVLTLDPTESGLGGTDGRGEREGAAQVPSMPG
jgi:hypothetical protein